METAEMERPAWVRALPVALLTVAVVFDFVGVLADEELLHAVAWGGLGLSVLAGLGVATFHLVQTGYATGRKKLVKTALLYPAIQLLATALIIGSVIARPHALGELPTASMALTVVGLGLWLITEQLRDELLRPLEEPKAPKAVQQEKRLRLVHSRP